MSEHLKNILMSSSLDLVYTTPDTALVKACNDIHINTVTKFSGSYFTGHNIT